MVDISFIDDNYLYKNAPLPNKMDRANVLSVIKIEQFTTIQDVLGTCLYEHLEAAMLAQTLTADEEELIKLVKYLLALHTARALVIFTRTAAASHSNTDATSHSQLTLDALSDSYSAKASYVADRLIHYVKGHADILAIATADGCDDDKFNDEDTVGFDGGSVFYPTPTGGGSGSSGSGSGSGNATDNGDGTITIGGEEGCDDPINGCD
jgi:hypothetical protein